MHHSDAALLLHEFRHVEQFLERRSFPLRYIWESCAAATTETAMRLTRERTPLAGSSSLLASLR
jgi:hypothetical protein